MTKTSCPRWRGRHRHPSIITALPLLLAYALAWVRHTSRATVDPEPGADDGWAVQLHQIAAELHSLEGALAELEDDPDLPVYSATVRAATDEYRLVAA